MSYGYQNALQGIANYIDSTLLPQERAKLAKWEADARAAGVYEGSIIVAVLQPWNVWDQGMADLSSVVIPNEMRRVQAGGADGVVSAFNWTFPPPLPDIGAMLAAQGGALVGAQQHTALMSAATPSEPVALPPSVLENATPALQSVVNNLTPTARPGATPGGPPLDPTSPGGVVADENANQGALGDPPQSGALGAGGNSGAPSLSSASGPNDPLPAETGLPVWGWALAAVALFFVFRGGRR